MSVLAEALPRSASGDARLGELLARAAEGDEAAFLEFYDATCQLVWRHELRRHRDERAAGVSLTARYATAWRRAEDQATSGLSVRAWLISLPLSGMPARVRAGGPSPSAGRSCRQTSA